jgi:hypothetical protein
MAASASYIFSTLEKFADNNNKVTLSQWLRKFDRCCTVAKKADGDDGNIKGQLLLLYVEGRARAILEEYEESQGNAALTYVALVAKLKEHFESNLTREDAMKKFESRVQKINESEEEFMLDLLKLYTLANPTHAAAIQLEAIKRKFMNGISPELRRNVFVFCNNPFAADVTRENLLVYCRNASMHLKAENATDNSTDNVLPVNNDGGASSEESPNAMITAINNLTTIRGVTLLTLPCRGEEKVLGLTNFSEFFVGVNYFLG